MRIEGEFVTRATGDQMRSLLRSAEGLSEVGTLRDVVEVDPHTLSMVFSPRLVMGPVPLSTTIQTVSESDERVELQVSCSRGAHSVEATLVLQLKTAEPTSVVNWAADVAVRGNVASVGQRVIRDIVKRTIGEILADSARVAENEA